VIVDSDEVRPTVFAVIADRTLLSHQPEPVIVKEPYHLAEGHGTPPGDGIFVKITTTPSRRQPPMRSAA